MADSGIAVLDSMIARLRTLAGPRVAERVAAKAAPKVDAAIKKAAAAGTTPDGKAWQPKVDGGRPLAHAADAIATKAHGNVIATTLTGPTVFHHLGLGGKPTRQVIPDSAAVPPAVEKAVTDAAAEIFREIVGGRG